MASQDRRGRILRGPDGGATAIWLPLALAALVLLALLFWLGTLKDVSGPINNERPITDDR